MSFDLYFCWRKPDRINFDEVKAWAAETECFRPNSAQLWYSNPKTGVYFSFDFEGKAPELPGDAPEMPDGYFDSGLSFNLNYNRPSYFGFEAMPIVERLASRFGLDVVDPQNLDGGDSVLVADREALTRSWIHHNRRAILVMIEQSDFSRPLSMPAAASLYLWRYGKAKEDLQRTCGEDVFVPTLAPVRRKDDPKAGRVIAYTEGLPMIIPQCEWVFIVSRNRGFLRSKKAKEVRVISSNTFRELLAGQIRSFDWQEPDVQIIRPESAERAGEIIRVIDATIPRSEFEVIGTDSFVDIDLPSVRG